MLNLKKYIPLLPKKTLRQKNQHLPITLSKKELNKM